MSPKRIKPHVEKAVLGFGIVNPLMALPQVYKVWVLGTVGGLSAVTIGAGLFMAALMTMWGVLEESAALWVPSLVWVAVNLALLFGVFRFA